MTTIYVQFTDASGTAIRNAFDGPQSPGENLGTVNPESALWRAFYKGLPAEVKQYVAVPE